MSRFRNLLAAIVAAITIVLAPAVNASAVEATAVGAKVVGHVAKAPAKAAAYTVRRGDTLSEIAARYDTTWQHLYNLNRDRINDPDLIYPGQEFTVTGKAAAPAKAPQATSARRVRPATGAVTSPYGMRTHPITGVYKLHSGTDYSYGNGGAYAAAAGTVDVTHPGWAGNLVTINHGGGVQIRYAHLASVSVSDGQRVNAGDRVGTIGALGLATGAHLHFEVLVDGDYVNPATWLGQ